MASSHPPYPSSADTCCADVNLIVKDTPPTYMGACLVIHWSAYGMLFVRKDIKQFSKHYVRRIDKRTGIGVTTCTDSDCWHEYLRIACHSVCCILPVCRHPPQSDMVAGNRDIVVVNRVLYAIEARIGIIMWSTDIVDIFHHIFRITQFSIFNAIPSGIHFITKVQHDVTGWSTTTKKWNSDWD